MRRSAGRPGSASAARPKCCSSRPIAKILPPSSPRCRKQFRSRSSAAAPISWFATAASPVSRSASAAVLPALPSTRARSSPAPAALHLNVALFAGAGRHRRARIPLRHSGDDRRRAADERRRLRPRDQGRAGLGDGARPRRPRPCRRGRGDGVFLSPLRGRPGLDLCRGAAARGRRRCRRDRAADGRDPRGARSDPADPRPHRRLDVQQPAGRCGLAADRRGRLPRARARRGDGVAASTRIF